MLQATLKHHRRRPAGRRDLDLETTAAGRSAWLMIAPIIPRRFFAEPFQTVFRSSESTLQFDQVFTVWVMCEQQVLYRHNKGVLKTPETQIQLLDDQVIVRCTL